MARTVGIVALVAVSLIAMSAVKADAHYTIVKGKLVYHSVFCDSVIKNVQNLVKDPAQATCSVVGTAVETECANPQGHIVRGTASHPIEFQTVSGGLAQNALEKKQGRAHFSELIPGTDEPDLGLTDEEAGCNNLWTVTRALLREADVTIDVYSCGADDVCTPEDIVDANHASTGVFHCVLPAQYSLENPPPAGLEVDCPMESFTHIQ